MAEDVAHALVPGLDAGREGQLSGFFSAASKDLNQLLVARVRLASVACAK